MYCLVKHFTPKAKVFETINDEVLAPICNKYGYFKTLDGTYVDGVVTNLTKKELTKELKNENVEVYQDLNIARWWLSKYFKDYKPTDEADLHNWNNVILELYNLCDENYKDVSNLYTLFKKFEKENFVEFLTYFKKPLKDLTVDQIITEHKSIAEHESKCVTTKTLKETYNFTQKMIDTLLPNPILTENPYYTSAPPMKLYRLKTVLKVMKTSEYSTMLASKRKKKV